MPKTQPVTVRYADGTTKTVRDSEISKPLPYWRSEKWRRLRMRALERDGFRCTVCQRKRGDQDPRLRGGRRTRLEVHHLTYERFGDELLADLVTLCQRCHSTEHAWRRRLGRPLQGVRRTS